MPRISEFYGIVIRIHWADHAPPHFHAFYGESMARFVIATGEVLDRGFPVRATRLVRQWIALHREELNANWNRAQKLEPPVPVDPLP